MSENLLEFYINTLKEINQNYKSYRAKRYYRAFRLTDVVRHYIIYTTEFKAQHKGILLDLIQEYYCYFLTNRL